MNDEESQWHRLLEKKIDRRSFWKLGAAAGAVASAGLTLSGCSSISKDTGSAPFFCPIVPNTTDDFVIAGGFEARVLVSWGDDIGVGTFGFNNDFLAYLPIDYLEKGPDLAAPQRGFASRQASSCDGLLISNHEYSNALFTSRYESGVKSAAQLRIEQDAVGVGVVRVTRGRDGQWAVDRAHPLNRKITALTPHVMTGVAAAIDGGPHVIGTMQNCSGGVTPWGTILSCEENFEDAIAPEPDGSGWPEDPYALRHYGWVVEIDPFDPSSVPRKHTAMGRFRHENVAMRVGADRSVVAYMGDDLRDSCVYKFIADGRYAPDDRSANLRLMETGKLYAADFSKGRWVLLDYAEPKIREAKLGGKPRFSSQADVLADAREAALAAGGTPVDRPEDLEIHPLDGSVFIALTNNRSHGNFHGQIVRLEETASDPLSMTFEWSIFAVGGPQSGFSCPDNMTFDDRGGLWVASDVASGSIGRGIYRFAGNSALHYFPPHGGGAAHRFASGPIECELAGPTWTPDGSTLFLSVQHPGELTETYDNPTSHWPRGGSEIPRPSVMAITGFDKRRG